MRETFRPPIQIGGCQGKDDNAVAESSKMVANIRIAPGHQLRLFFSSSFRAASSSFCFFGSTLG